MLNKVLILSAGVGAGHMRAAQCVEQVLKARGVEQVQVVDVLPYLGPFLRALSTRVYLKVATRAPDLHSYYFDHFDQPFEKERRRLAFNLLNTRKLVKFIRQAQPDLIICTYFLPAEIVSWMIGTGRLTCRHAVVVTDLDVHAMWLHHHYDHYFVGIPEAKAYLEALGMAGEKIIVSGIPIDPVFAQAKDKRQMRLKHHLEPELATILVAAGGWGVGPIEQLMQFLRKMRHPAQVVAICGNNAELRQRLENYAQSNATHHVRIRPIGFTREMDEYMSAADLLIGKPGGLTMSEALAKALVMVIVDPLRGQEERNSDHLLEAGAALRCNNLPALAWKIDNLLDDPARLAAMQAAARKLAQPDAAATIIDTIL